MLRTTLRGGALAGCCLVLGIVPGVAQAITVTSNAATGPGTLAAAIAQANATPSLADTITFNLGASNRVISIPAPGLPTVTGPVTIDGTSEPGYAGAPLVQLVGCPSSAPCTPGSSSGGNGQPGLRLGPGAAGSTVAGLSVVRFNEGGILVEAPGSVIAGNYVGVDLTGTGPGVGNGKGGVIVAASNVTVGGLTAADRNVIGDNHQRCGVAVTAGTGSVVRGNYIGTDATGNAGLGNQSLAPEAPSCGVRVEGAAAQTTIGGPSAAARNIISGNNVNGVEVTGGTDTAIEGNWIGLGADGTSVLSNTDYGALGSGVLVAGGTSTVVGGAGAAVRNVISGNSTRAGVELAGGTATVQGNFIGTGPDGIAVRSNRDGVLVSGAGATVAGNLVSGNSRDGIRLGSGARDAVVVANQVGGAVGGDHTKAGNGGAQIHVTGSAADTRIGASSAPNTVLDVSGTGPIVLDGTGTGNTVRGNLVRLNGATYRTAIDRGSPGIDNAGTPQLTAINTTGSRTQVTGTLTGAPSTTYAVDVYADTGCDSDAHRAITSLFGSGAVTTNALGNGTISFPVDAPPPGARLLATATDPAGSTGELGTCADAPQAAPALELSDAAYSAPESAGAVHVTIVRTGGGPGSAGIRVRTGDETAVAGRDYTPLDGFRTVNAPPEPQTTDVAIPIRDDGVQGGNRTFTVDLAEPNAAVQGPRVHATVTIVDDTPAPPPPRTTPTTTTPVPPPPLSPATATVTRPHGTVRRARVTAISGKGKGTAAARVRRVEVAVTRVARCERLGPSGRLVRARVALRKACPPAWLRATGTATWRYRLKRALPAGAYRIAARAIDVHGRAGRVRTVSVRLR